MINSDRSKAVVLLLFSVFGFRVSMTFHLTCVYIVLSSVWVAEWPAAHSADHMLSLYFDYL